VVSSDVVVVVVDVVVVAMVVVVVVGVVDVVVVDVVVVDVVDVVVDVVVVVVVGVLDGNEVLGAVFVEVAVDVRDILNNFFLDAFFKVFGFNDDECVVVDIDNKIFS
jgi:hypothetical protein